MGDSAPGATQKPSKTDAVSIQGPFGVPGRPKTPKWRKMTPKGHQNDTQSDQNGAQNQQTHT